ncbi:hypothetical protein [Methylopila turkensis]|uniref:General secretion pathway protein N n=1 Tax=Methylopila turkensis TaxID=1437816 RepID=A0A9W6N790_9HYPH|nr:hypothetical protein [Methylopila turkensis]GLK80170.1 hypothetical protein GCM10008174_19110 [Methylopila turkensis]
MSLIRTFGTLALAVAGALSARAQEPPPSGLNPLQSLGAASLTGFRDRPLFTPSRRPPPAPVADEAPAPLEEAAAPEPPPAVQPSLRLTGVIEGPDESVAVIEELGSKQVSQLRLGDMLDGWLVTAIDPAALRLTLGEREEEYRLFDPKPDAPAQGGTQD